MKRYRYLLWILAGLLVALLFWFARIVFPLAGSDSVVFLVPALSYAQNGNLLNPLYYVGRLTGGSRTDLFNYYVPLFPMLTGMLGRFSPNVAGCFTVSAVFGALNISILTRQFSKSAVSSRSVKGFVFMCLAVTYAATYFFPTIGRPEILSAFWIACIYVVYQHRKSLQPIVFNLAISGLLALALATQITAFVFSFLILLLAELLEQADIGSVLARNLLRTGTAMLIALGILALSPVGILPTLKGVWLHTQLVFNRQDRSPFLYLYYWMLSSVNFGFIILVATTAAFFLQELWVQWPHFALVRRAAVIIVLLVILGCTLKLVCYTSPTVYNATQFIVPILAYLLRSLFACGSSLFRCFKWPVAAVWVWGVVILVRTVTLGIDYRADGRDFDTMAPKFDSVVKANPGCYVTSGLWSLSSQPFGLKIHHDDRLISGDVIVVQNAYEWIKPEVLQHWRLIYDCRVPRAKMWMGMPVRHPQGYTFAIYRVR